MRGRQVARHRDGSPRNGTGPRTEYDGGRSCVSNWALNSPSTIRCARRMPDMIEVYTARHEREHGHPPQGKRFWRFVLVSQSVTAKDHTLVLDQPMIYPMALEKAQEVAVLRKSIRIIVEP